MNMMEDKSLNPIFQGDSTKSKFAAVIYRLLMQGEEIDSTDVYCAFWGIDRDSFHDKISNVKGYQKIKDAFTEVKNAINGVYPDSVPQKSPYRYTNEDRDPLGYFDFIFSKYINLPFHGSKNGDSSLAIQLDFNFDLKNIELIPFILNAIDNNKRLNFQYKSFKSDTTIDYVLHPHILKLYNGRWFLFGKVESSTNEEDMETYPFNVSIDRIIGSSLSTVKGEKYIAADKAAYQKYFAERVGVSQKRNTEGPTTIVIRTKSKYMHGLMVTKPLHSEWKETAPFGKHDDSKYWYGEIQYTNLEPNNELKGKIMCFGSGLEVMEPKSLRIDIAKDVDRMSKFYCSELAKLKEEKEKEKVKTSL